MRPRISPWWWALGLILGLRLVSMAWLPLAGTSEPRYAEVARLMAVTGDWITPWFTPDQPFWGKPPLSFWTEALAFRLLGVTELAARLPSWLATLGSMGLLFVYARRFFGERIAQGAVLIYATCALVYIASGAVITDPFLALATTWAMVALALSAKTRHPAWRYGFFVALALGLLAKGPLMLVLVAGPLLPLVILYPSIRSAFKQLPWLGGLALMLLLSAPWYLLAELKTPGFLNYFLVGEHFLRFIDSGWAGDLYGVAHRRIKGAIWADALMASFPWGLVALALLLRQLWNPVKRSALWQMRRDPDKAYLVAWTLFTPAFFSLSDNILWTYMLPALAPFSVLLALALAPAQASSKVARRLLVALTSLVPLALTAYMVLGVLDPLRLKTEKHLVAYAMHQMQAEDKLLYLNEIPFSATFYSRGQAGAITLKELTRQTRPTHRLYLALPKDDLNRVSKILNQPLKPLFESHEFVLTEIAGRPNNP
ncbi:glycosyltransferase family 39 protein [Rhodoferax sp.]|uniref:ArnT family glycosyltransferase n=1 Tax=Rhodoferax sp. TaxID=50421 RepID=UPI0025DE2EF5|nr:glycosyltransferase family 39 protein [Rhodoferax sp.]